MSQPRYSRSAHEPSTPQEPGEPGSTMALETRYYRALPIDDPGYEEETLSLSLASTALVGMHCWNIGCPDGPAVDVDFCVGAGWPQSTQEAARIMTEVIRPSMDLARRSGLQGCHVESDWMDAQYPQVPSTRSTEPATLHPHQQAMLERAHGIDYMTRSPLAHMRRAEVASPQGEEPLFFYTDPFDEYLQSRGIDTLIYTGFMADMCILAADGGARAMVARGYRCILMRDGTVGVETPESFPQRLATRYGIHIFEWSLGHGTSFAQYRAAMAQIEKEGQDMNPGASS